MQCPVCESTKLAIAERQGIEIDYCPDCRGVWLDRGELDKIIDRAARESESSDREHRDRGHRDRDSDDRHHHGHGHDKKRKRKSMLSELFDF